MMDPIYPEFNLDLFKMGHFILYRHEKGLIGNRIVKAQLDMGFSKEDAQYTHIDVSGGGPYAVRVNPPSSREVDIRKQYPGKHIIVVKYLAVDYAINRYKVAYKAATHCNIVYDFTGVLKFRIPFLPNFDGNYFCSENALWALQFDYEGALGIKPAKCMPAHFLNRQCFGKVWEGVIPK